MIQYNEMSTGIHSGVQLVITMALKKEVPSAWFTSNNLPVHTLAALKSGALIQTDYSQHGILAVITGAGLKASEEAARWICDNLTPLFVLNIGTCGIINERLSPATWTIPGFTSVKKGDVLELDTRLPVPLPDNINHVNSLLSVDKPVTGTIPSSWGKHDIIDMECHSQAKIFRDSGISFHCLKFGTDYSDADTQSDFNRNLDVFREETTKLFTFLELRSSPVKISVVVPVYNRSLTIRRAIDSVLSQSLVPEEIIVVDDCSTDDTGEILQSYGDRISYIHLSENSGPSKARNEGARHTRTGWIAFMDSDDFWEKDKLKGQIACLRKYPFYQILQSEEKWIRNGKRVNQCRHHKKPFGWIWGPSLERCLVSPSGVLMKKSLLEQYGLFNEDLPVCEDYDLWLRISRHHPVGLDPSLTVIKHGGHSDQLSRSYPAMDRFRVKSLHNIFAGESQPSYRDRIIAVLKKKLIILINGCEKRGKSREAGKYQKILKSLSDQQ